MDDSSESVATGNVSTGDVLSALSGSFVELSCLVDSDGYVVEVLCGSESMAVVTAEENIEETHVRSVFHDRVSDRLAETVQTVLRDDVCRQFEVSVTEQRRRWYQCCVAPVGEGTTHAVTAIRDVSSQRGEVEQQRQALDDILASIDDVFYMYGSDGRLRRWNESLTTVTGYTPEELDDSAPSMFFAPEDHDRIHSAIERVFEEGHHRIEAEILTKDGTAIPYQFVANTLEMPDGERVVCGIGRDISARVEREQQVGAFGRVLRHNIGNALTVIFAEMEHLEREVRPDLHPHIERIDNRAETLLDLSKKGQKITTTLLERQFREELRLQTVVEHTVEELRSVYPDTTITHTVPAEATVLGIPNLHMAVYELVENACEHNSDPKVNVSVGMDEETARVSIVDDGTGVPPNEANIITQETSITPLFHGVGMGLWLVRWVIKQSGGVVDYTDRDCGGARFDIVLERPAGV